MPLDIDGAGRSRSLACLPTAGGTVAPTLQILKGRAGFFPGCFLAPLLRANFGTRGPESQGGGGQQLQIHPRQQGLQGLLGAASTTPTQPSARPLGASRGLQGPPGPSRGLWGLWGLQEPPGGCRVSRGFQGLQHLPGSILSKSRTLRPSQILHSLKRNATAAAFPNRGPIKNCSPASSSDPPFLNKKYHSCSIP